MNTIETLKEAIKLRKQVSFTYEDDILRIGNPYIIFYSRNKKDNTLKILIDMKRKKQEEVEFKWRPYNIEKINKLKILESSFVVDIDEYKPNSSKYDEGVIFKIDI
jgi:hypothetical protein